MSGTQLPSYKPVMFGGGKSPDGAGVNIVYYFALPDDFDEDTFPNKVRHIGGRGSLRMGPVGSGVGLLVPNEAGHAGASSGALETSGL